MIHFLFYHFKQYLYIIYNLRARNKILLVQYDISNIGQAFVGV